MRGEENERRGGKKREGGGMREGVKSARGYRWRRC